VVAGFSPRALVALDLVESAHVAFENTRHLPNVHVAIGDLHVPPVRPVFDLAFSVGVIHHLPEPAVGVTRLAEKVRDGGRVVVWVYGKENNEWIVRLVDPVRKSVTARLPGPLLRGLLALPSAALWTAINHVYPALPAGARDRLPYAEYFASLAGMPWREIHNIVFDQLVTPVAHYLTGDEVRAFFARDFRDVTVRWKGRYSWTGVGTVVRGAESPRPQ
jgi:SAM-dependent methyltransferase